MPRVCTRPCDRLITAAVFICVSVVQFIVGVILLKSQLTGYRDKYLLSGPNFWTATLNFCVGCTLGFSATVWKDTSGPSPKYAVRRHCLAALVFSGLVMNGVTSGIMIILGEDNEYLSIHLGSNGIYSTVTLASELLAYAYSVSICSPIVCVVVSITYLTGICCRPRDNSAQGPGSHNKSILKKRNSYNWVYKPEQQELSDLDTSIIRKTLAMMSYASSSDDDDDDSSSSTEFPVRSNSVPSKEYLAKFHKGQRIRTHSDGNMVRKFTNDDITSGNIFTDRNRVSFSNETVFHDKSPRKNKEIQKSQFQTDLSPSEMFEFKNKRNPLSLTYEEFKDRCRRLEKLRLQPRRKRMVLKEDLVFSCYENCDRDESDKNLTQMSAFSKLSSIPPPNDKVHLKRVFSVKADVHEIPKDNVGQMPGKVLHDNLTPNYNTERSFDVSTRADDDFSYENSKLRRTSTAKSLNSTEESNSQNLADLSIHHNTDSNLSDLKTPEGFPQNRYSKLYQRSMSRGRESFADSKSVSDVLPSPGNSLQTDCSKSDSVLNVIDTSFETKEQNQFSGEIVPIRLNTSQPLRRLSSNLIPVSIPIVPDSSQTCDKYIATHSTLKCNNSLTGSNHKSERVKFSSFRGGARNKREASYRGDEENEAKEMKTLPNREGLNVARVDSVPEESEEMSFSSSNAETSGYNSALDENVFSVSQHFKSRYLAASCTTLMEGNLHDNNTSRKTSEHISHQDFEGPSTSKGKSRKSNFPIDQIEPYISEQDFEVESQKEASELLKDRAFLKVLQQALKGQSRT